MVVDLKKIADKTAIRDTLLLKNFVRDYFNICQNDLNKLEAALEKGDLKGVVHRAHNIMSVSKKLWLEEISHAAEAIEKSAKEKDMEKIKEHNTELIRLFAAGKDAVSKMV